MCLILFAWRPVGEHRLVVAANRDEFHGRPALGAHFWPDHPDLLAGRDLSAQGTWLGMTRAGRFAAITNYRNPAERRPEAPSRGSLVRDFLDSTGAPRPWFASLAPRAIEYNGFSMVAADRDSMCFFSNRGDGSIQEVAAGVHGLSNHLLDTPWPKVRRGMSALAGSIAPVIDFDGLLAVLADTTEDNDAELPDTGIGVEWERRLSAIRIVGRDYGTRCSTVLRIGTDGGASLVERTWRRDGTLGGDLRYSFSVSSR